MVTGFPSTAIAECFRLGFERAYADLPAPSILKTNKGRRMDQVDYRQTQMSFVLNTMMDHYQQLHYRSQQQAVSDVADLASAGQKLVQEVEGLRVSPRDLMDSTWQDGFYTRPGIEPLKTPLTLDQLKSLREVKPDALDLTPEIMERTLCEQNPGLFRLNVYWKDEELKEKMEEKVGGFHMGLDHYYGIPVSEIDKACWDPRDLEDDRNYHLLKMEAIGWSKFQKYQVLAEQMDVPVEDVPRLLHESRLKSFEELTKRKGKAAKKALKYITVREGPPTHALPFINASKVTTA